MSRVKLGAIVAVLLLLGVGASAFVVHQAGAEAAPYHWDQTIDLAGQPVYDPSGGQCVAESVTITQGTVRIMGSGVQDAQGGIHGTFDVEVHALAAGDTSGAQYELTSHTHDTMQNGAVYNFTEVFRTHLNGQGPDNGVAVSESFHITVTPDGQFTADHFRWELGCA